jgi:hypothetical protein
MQDRGVNCTLFMCARGRGCHSSHAGVRACTARKHTTPHITTQHSADPNAAPHQCRGTPLAGSRGHCSQLAAHSARPLRRLLPGLSGT